MKILLLSVPADAPDSSITYKQRSEGEMPITPKIAIVSLIKWMEKHGYTSEMYDYYDIDMQLPSDIEIREYLREFKPNVIGLSAVVSTSYKWVKKLAAIIREELPDVWIVCGGALTASSNVILNKTSVDLCVVGDGEIAWVNILDYIKANHRKWDYDLLNSIKGLAYLNTQGELIFTGYSQKIPNTEMVFPDYDILKMGVRKRPESFKNYFRPGLGSTWFKTDERSYEPHRKKNMAFVWVSKGCVARCTFCQRSIKGYRVHDTISLEEHLLELKEKYDVGFIHITDENFASNMKHAYDVAALLKKLDLLWVASGVRCSSVKEEDVKYFKENNCSGLKYGIESGSQKILDVMEKRFTTDDIYNALSWCNKYQVYSPLAVMAGMPGETIQTAIETGKFLGRISHMQGLSPEYGGFSVFYALPLTGTPLYEYGQRCGVIGSLPDDEEEYLLNVSGTGAGKQNYVNLNGAPIREVLFWERLFQIESFRTYSEELRKKPIVETFMNRVLRENKIAERESSDQAKIRENKEREVGSFTISMRGVKRFIYFGISLFIDRHVIYNPFFTYIPRWILYPLIQTALYFEYLLQGFIGKIRGRAMNLHVKRARISRLSKEYDTIERGSERSLRKIVARDRPEPESESEKNRQILVKGF